MTLVSFPVQQHTSTALTYTPASHSSTARKSKTMAKEALRLAARSALLLLVFFHLSSLVISSSPSALEVINAERRIDLTSHLVRVYLTLQVKNSGPTPISEVLLAFPPAQADSLALVKAAIAVGKRKKKMHVPLDVKQTEISDAPNDTKYYTVSLLDSLNNGETATIEVLYILTHSLEPFPKEIKQSESQLVHFHDSSIILSPYPVKEQITLFKMPTFRVESFTVAEPTNHAGKELKYGPYKDQPSYSYSPILLHFENNNPFAVVEELEREIEISHWGSLQITESYKLVHGGARHKIFSRVEYQSRGSGASSFKHLLATLPPKAHSVYYRDEIGNISSSHFRSDKLKSILEFEPRYPLFGGWKATFVIGYAIPLEDFLFEAPDGRRFLNFTFGCPLVETVVDKLTVKVVLPEGSKNPVAEVPFLVDQQLETKYSYLDVVGRNVLVLEKKNVVPDHNVPFKVHYEFNPIFMLAEPLMLTCVFFLFFVAVVTYLHTDLSIRKV